MPGAHLLKWRKSIRNLGLGSLCTLRGWVNQTNFGDAIFTRNNAFKTLNWCQARKRLQDISKLELALVGGEKRKCV